MNEDYYILIARLLSRQLSNAEERGIEAKIGSDPQASRALAEIRGFLSTLEHPPAPDAIPDTAQGWRQLSASLELDAPAEATAAAPRSYRHYLYAAAAVFTLLAGSFFVLDWLGRPEMTRISAGNAALEEVRLGDGSVVWLNSGTSITYGAVDFPENRVVALEGEAFFQVADDAAHPFVVKTAHSITTVAGTSFNLRARDQRTILFVESGGVRFAPRDGDGRKEVLVGAGSMCLLVNGNITAAEPVSEELMMSWLHNKLNFYKTPLVEIIAELERVYDIHISFEGQAGEHLSLTGTFEKRPVEEVLETLCLALELEYEIEKDLIILRAP